MNLGSALQAGQALLAVAIALAPMYYQKISIFACKSEKAIQRLSSESPRDTTIVEGEEIELRWVESDEPGFGEIIDIIKNEGVESGEVWVDDFPESISQIGVADGPKSAVKEYVGELGFVPTPIAVMYIEYTDDNREIVAFEAFAPNRVRNALQLKRWTKERLRKRSHYVTTGLALLFTVVSFSLIYRGG